MTPSVRSRLWASGTSFALGFALANYGVLFVARPDQWLWTAAAVVLMGTGVAGVVFADTRRSVSIWSILGVELFTIFTLVPLLWTFTLATSPDAVPRDLVPRSVSWSVFSDVLSSDLLRHAAATSALVAGIATAIAMPLALGAAYGLVVRPAIGRRVVYALVVSALLLPLVAVAAPLADQLIALDKSGSRLALVPPTLLITLPLAIWLCVTVYREAPWPLREAALADGATRRQALRRFALPHLAPGVLVATLLVFVAGCNDFVLGAALAPGDESRPLPATLLLATSEVDNADALIAAAGLLWLVPVVIVVLVFPRRIHQLLGRSYR